MDASQHPIYEFGHFRLDSRQHTLLRDSEVVPLPPKAFDILLLLVESYGGVLSKTDLLERVWPGTYVDENNLAQQISMLRKYLGESSEKPAYIETVPRLGYRFIAPVERLNNHSEPLPGLPAAQTSRTVVRRLSILWTTAGIAVIALLVGGAYLIAGRHVRPSRAGPKEIRSLAILPLANLSGDPSQDYFADAMTDSLITNLAQIRELRVISETSSMHYKGQHKTLPEIARELNVDGVVEGSVFRSGDHVRITAQLVEASIDRHLWAGSYEGELRDVLRLQDNVARDIASEIKVTLTPHEQQLLTTSPPINSEAYNLYLQGSYFQTKVTEDFLRKAINTLQQSIEKDPGYAPSHAALALAYEKLSTNGYEPPLKVVPRAKTELTRALELDESLAEAHANLGYIRFTFDWDWLGAEKELVRAIELNPNSAEAQSEQGVYLVATGHFDEAISQMRRAQSLDPVGLDSSLFVGQYYLLAGRYNESLAALKKTLELDPNFLPAHAELALAYARLGDLASATVEYQKTRSLMAPRQALVLDQWMAPVEILLGKRAEASETAEWWSRESAHRYTDAYILGAFYSELGWKDRAIKSLEKGYEQRSPSMVYLKYDSNFPDSVRSDSRFENIVRRLNFPQ